MAGTARARTGSDAACRRDRRGSTHAPRGCEPGRLPPRPGPRPRAPQGCGYGPPPAAAGGKGDKGAGNRAPRSEERRVGKEGRTRWATEDGIRGGTVTGVQTCALPIYVLVATPLAVGIGAVPPMLPVDANRDACRPGRDHGLERRKVAGMDHRRPQPAEKAIKARVIAHQDRKSVV